MEKELLKDWLKGVFKLNSYEASLYLALLENDKLTPGELAKITDVPRSRIYDTLISLEKKGFVRSFIGKTTKFMAVSPEEVIETLKKKKELEYVESVLQLEKLKETEEFKTLQRLYSKKPKVFTQSEIMIVYGTPKIYSELLKLVKQLLNEKLIISSDSNSEVLGILSTLKPVLSKKNNVKVIVISKKAKEDEVKLASGTGNVEVKNVKEIPGRFVIIDDKCAVIFSDFRENILDEKDDRAIVTFQRGVILPLIKIVENL